LHETFEEGWGEPGATKDEKTLAFALYGAEDFIREAIEQQETWALEDPQQAGAYLQEELIDDPLDGVGVDQQDLDSLLDSQNSSQPPERTVLIAKLVHQLRDGWTAQGVIHWFSRQRYQLENRTPLELIDEDLQAATEILLSLARGGRAQVAT
jgi:hypothetical protein